MEVTVIRLNRPLMLMRSTAEEESYRYKTIYGFVIQDPIKEVNFNKVEEYTGYLGALHMHFSGWNDFTINKEYRGLPDWKDKKGVVHTSCDAWMKKIIKKAKEKLNLSYTIIPMDMDEETYSHYVDTQHHIVDEDFYYYLEDYGSETVTEPPLWEEDDLPF